MLPNSSLTAPRDRSDGIAWTPTTGAPLSDAELSTVRGDCLVSVPVYYNEARRVDRSYADPAVPLQHIGLISWIPARGALPDADGVYGFAKLRGTYSLPQEADQRAEELVRNVDSYHQIFHAPVGRPFPLTTKSTWSQNTREIDLRTKMADTMDHSVQQKRTDELQAMREIRQQEEKLRSDVARTTEDPLEAYTTLRVKYAQVAWTYLETGKKLTDMRGITAPSTCSATWTRAPHRASRPPSTPTRTIS